MPLPSATWWRARELTGDVNAEDVLREVRLVVEATVALVALELAQVEVGLDVKLQLPTATSQHTRCPQGFVLVSNDQFLYFARHSWRYTS